MNFVRRSMDESRYCEVCRSNMWQNYLEDFDTFCCDRCGDALIRVGKGMSAETSEGGVAVPTDPTVSYHE